MPIKFSDFRMSPTVKQLSEMSESDLEKQAEKLANDQTFGVNGRDKAYWLKHFRNMIVKYKESVDQEE